MLTTTERDAVAMYAVMSRDPSDALDMINECESIPTLELLLAMLEGKGTARTDHRLNAIMIGPTKRRIERLRG